MEVLKQKPANFLFINFTKKNGMKIKLILVGKTDIEYIETGFRDYEQRIKHYTPFETIAIAAVKNTRGHSFSMQKEVEGELIMKCIAEGDFLVLLDEKGKEFRSVELANWLQGRMNSGIKSLVFVVGGPYGFSEKVKKRSNIQISLSRLTFSHQMVRLFFIEQIYRSLTILKNEPYHHE